MKNAQLGVIGMPITHSLSPDIFRAFGKAQGREIEAAALEVSPSDLEKSVRSAAKDNWTGWSVTVPHKIKIMDHLDDIAPSARLIGAANCVHFEKGRSTGHNTDADGLLSDLGANGFEPRGKTAVVLGSGGAARAACAALREGDVKNLFVLGRSKEKVSLLAADFNAHGGDSGDKSLSSADIIVNATSAGLDGITSPLAENARFSAKVFVYDMIYRPKMTPFLKMATASGARTANGLGMLVYQAAASWKIWFGESLSQDVIAATRAQLDRDLI